MAKIILYKIFDHYEYAAEPTAMPAKTVSSAVPFKA